MMALQRSCTVKFPHFSVSPAAEIPGDRRRYEASAGGVRTVSGRCSDRGGLRPVAWSRMKHWHGDGDGVAMMNFQDKLMMSNSCFINH